ncbi:hypothetical protein [Roseimaritima ulvae]|uniref:Uncharacterized protein n=1 Tax=Roseimaritima ulvae TaxID=980254 RepID=A0A5B9QLA5_9BACT|nr:hypothetical protein [Roseimaritima ulvae]QEG39808.1 hypothetical protein UC8_18070 [Roseimaritima ulvae]
MSHGLLNAPEYLRSPCPKVWQWSDGGDVATWADGRTAAFASQLALILQRLALSLGGLPPLTSLLLVLDAASQRENAASQTNSIFKLKLIAEIAEQHSLGGIGDMLQAVRSLPEELRGGVDAQVALLEYLLGECPKDLYEASETGGDTAQQWLQMPPEDRPFQDDVTLVDESTYLKARNRRVIAVLFFMANRSIDAQAIELLRRTRLESLPEPAELDSPASERTGDLLRELRDDQRFGSLAQTALAIAATVSLPRRPQDHDLLPAGGVSDISNRGNPEQLLLSELAQEPMALLARIATGQALYLRRESPPAPRPHCQPLLLEAGIRTWGQRRLQLTALALGISTSLQRREDVAIQAVTVAGDQHWEEDFLSRRGLIEHLERLPTDIHPGPAIAKWIETFNNTPSEEAVAEPILVLTANTDADPSFQASLRDVPRPYLVVLLQHDDTARILRRTAMGDERLQTITLGDASLGRPDAKASEARPLFVDLPTSPLRFTYEFGDDWCCVGQDAALWLLTRDGRLLWYPQARYGAIEVARGIRKSHVRAYRVLGNRLQLVVAPEETCGYLLTADGPLQHVNARVLELDGIDAAAAEYSLTEDAIWVFHDAYLSLFDPDSGQLVSRERCSGTKVGANVVLRADNELTVATKDAGRIEFQSIPNPLGSELGYVLQFSRGRWIAIAIDLSMWTTLHQHGTATAPTETGCKIVGAPANLLATSRDEQRVLFAVPPASPIVGSLARQQGVPRFFVLSLNGKMPKALSDAHSVSIHSVFEQTSLPSRFPAVRKKLVGLQPHPGGLVLFRTQVRSSVQLRVGTDGRHLQLLQFRGSVQDGFVEFGEPQPLDDGETGKTPRLRRADLPGGTVWLDSRGLLHMRSYRDDSELTLVLHDDLLAGWSSRWGSFGSPFFIGEDSGKPVPPQVIEWLRDFNQDCL